MSFRLKRAQLKQLYLFFTFPTVGSSPAYSTVAPIWCFTYTSILTPSIAYSCNCACMCVNIHIHHANCCLTLARATRLRITSTAAKLVHICCGVCSPWFTPIQCPAPMRLVNLWYKLAYFTFCIFSTSHNRSYCCNQCSHK